MSIRKALREARKPTRKSRPTRWAAQPAQRPPPPRRGKVGSVPPRKRTPARALFSFLGPPAALVCARQGSVRVSLSNSRTGIPETAGPPAFDLWGGLDRVEDHDWHVGCS